jgi:hypothetical protein
MADKIGYLDGREALVAYNKNSDQIKIGKLPKHGEPDWTYGMDMTTGAAYTCVRDMSDADVANFFKADFIAIVVRDGVCINATYREFRKVRQFVDYTPEDMPNQAFPYMPFLKVGTGELDANIARAENMRTFADYLENDEIPKAVQEYIKMDEKGQEWVEAILERLGLM